MAIMKNGKISGSIANVIWYTSNGKELMRSKPGPGKVRQAKITRINASNFGKASKMISPLLKGLAKELNFRMLPSNRGKVIGAVSKWLPEESKLTTSAFYSFPSLIDLNDLVAIENVLKIQTEVSIAGDNTLTVSFGAFIPDSTIKVVKNTGIVEIKTVLVYLGFDEEMKEIETFEYPVILEIIYNNKEVAAQTINFPVQPIAGSLFLLSLLVSYKGNTSGMNKERKWLPAGVLGVGKIV